MMRVRFWGVRGSIAAAGPETAQVGGNTSCVEVRCRRTAATTARPRRSIIFDAGTGLRRLGESLEPRGAPVDARTCSSATCTGTTSRAFPSSGPPTRRATASGSTRPSAAHRTATCARRSTRRCARRTSRSASTRMRAELALRRRRRRRGSSQSARRTVQAAAADASQRLPRLSRRARAGAASSTPPTPSTTPGAARRAAARAGARRRRAHLRRAVHRRRVRRQARLGPLDGGGGRAPGRGGRRRPARPLHHDPTHDDWQIARIEAATRARFPHDRRGARRAGADARRRAARAQRRLGGLRHGRPLLPCATDPERISEDAMAQKPNVLLAVGPLLQREVDLDELLDRLVTEIAEALGADRGTLYLVDPEAGELFSKAAHLPELQADPAQDRAGHRRHRRRDGAAAQPAVGRGRPALLQGHRPADRLPHAQRPGRAAARPRRQRHRRGAGAQRQARQLRRRRRGVLQAAGGRGRARRREHVALRAGAAAARDAARASLPVRYRYNRIVGESAAMQRRLRAHAQGGRHRRHGAPARRERHRQGADRARHPLQQRAPRRPVREARLHDHPADADGERALRPRARRLHRRRGARRAASARRPTAARSSSTRSASCRCRCRPRSCASCRTASSSASAARARSSADVRVVAATHRDLEALVGRGEFREDLYYRVKVVQLTLPPLRERGAEDVIRLAEHFLDVYRRKHGKPLLRFGAAARERLVGASLAGQHPRARALRGERGRACARARDRRRRAGAAAGGRRPRSGDAASGRVPRAAAGRGRARARVRTLAAVDGNRSRAAELLGIGRNTLLRKLKEYGKA